MSELKLLDDRIKNLTTGLLGMADSGTMQVSKAFLESVREYMVELLALRRAQPDNEPLTLEEQWVEIASDSTNYVLAYADGLYCVTDSAGRVVCEFIRHKPEGGEGGDG